MEINQFKCPYISEIVQIGTLPSFHRELHNLDNIHSLDALFLGRTHCMNIVFQEHIQ